LPIMECPPEAGRKRNATQTLTFRGIRYTLSKDPILKVIIMAIIKVTEKGQVTLPIGLRRKLGIRKDDYLAVETEGECLRLRKVPPVKPLAPDDPIWALIGKGSSGKKDVSRRHDDYLAEGERKRWRRS